MASPNGKTYEFADFRLVPGEGLLLRNGEPVPLSLKAFATLVILVERHGHLVQRSELIESVWQDTFVEEANISKCVWSIRNALGEDPKESKFIQTVPRRGYRFVARVSVVDGSGAFRLTDLAKVNNDSEKLLTRIEIPNSNGVDDTVLIPAVETVEPDVSESFGLINATPVLDRGAVNSKLIADSFENDIVELPTATKRRKGLRRGLRFLIWGSSLWFVFTVLLKVLNILGAILAESGDTIPSRAAYSTSERIGDLLVMMLIPIGLGMFTGIGLSLFGFARMIYALFEKESSGSYTAIVERVMVVLIAIAILAVAVPNLMYSYREANRASEARRIAIGGKRSIAVLPLKPIDPANRSNDYEIGIADAVIQRLSSINGFEVRPLSSTRGYTNIDHDPFAAGREQKVDYVVTSNYQIANGRMRVTSQFLNVSTGKIEDTFTVMTDSSNLFSAQDVIANDLGNKLSAKFGVDTREFHAIRGTENQDAYRYYLMAMNITEERGVQNVHKALEFFEKAVELDPKFARAWAGIAHTRRDLVGHRDPDAKGNYEKSMDAINKALAIDPNLSDAYSSLCQNKLRYEYDPVGAEKECRRALELDPNSPLAHKIYANFLYSQGRFDESIASIRRAMDLQPVSYRNQQIYGLALLYARRFPDAEAQFKRLLDLNPNHTFIHQQLVTILLLQGKEAEAFGYLINGLMITNANDPMIERYKAAYANAGWRGVTLEQIKTEDKTRTFEFACLYARIGDKDKAFEYLGKAYEERSHLIAVLKVAPQLDPLRDDPRYTALVQRIDGK